jgi:hypothetical protein
LIARVCDAETRLLAGEETGVAGDPHHVTQTRNPNIKRRGEREKGRRGDKKQDR